VLSFLFVVVVAIRLYSGVNAAVGRAMAMNTGQLAGNDVAKVFITKYITHDPNPKKPTVKTEILAAVVRGYIRGDDGDDDDDDHDDDEDNDESRSPP
jgi:phosphoribosylformylglycinamidine (FGAM) synthase PurS component